MCGFYFQYNKKESNFICSKKILKSLKHRGPDDNGVYKKKNILAIHTLLKIQDITSNSKQPYSIKFNKKKFNIIYNGEIYNKKEIKEKILKLTNYQFKTDGDTELFLLSFILWGKNFIKKIEGMFSYVIWCEDSKKIYFGRDQFAQKPLYFFDTSKYLILSSEIKPILMALNFYKEKISLNKVSIKNYFLTNNFSNNKNTFFQKIKQINGGDSGYLVNKKIKIKKILKLKKPNKKNITFQKVDDFENFIENIVNQHLIGKVKTGIALSSGADSRFLLYLISKNKKILKNLTAFTFVFENLKNEAHDVKIICKKLNINHVCIYLKNKSLLKEFKKLIKFNEFPLGGLPQIAMFKLCEKAKKKGIKVLIGGYGADEHFGSYKSFSSRATIENQLVDGRIFNNQEFIKKPNKIKNNKKLIKKSFYNKKIDYFVNLKIPRTSLMCDRFSMSNSVEFRNPFLDRRVYNFINLTNYTYIQNIKKYPIIQILKQKGLFMNKYVKNYIQSPQKQFMKNKKIIKILRGITNDKIFSKNFDFIKIDRIITKIKTNEILAWQIMNIYFFFHTFKKFLSLKN
jgi:asparagine synthase (glutamine-hydrolysing)